MKAQEAAYKLLAEAGRPMTAREIAHLAVSNGMVTSRSPDPVQSIAATIEKNIRAKAYNRPALAFINTSSGRRIGLPNWNPEGLDLAPVRRKVAVTMPEDLARQVNLALQAGVGSDLDDTVARLLRRGLKAYAHEIRSSVLKQLDGLD